MSHDQFLIPHNPNNLKLPTGLPHYPKSKEHTKSTKQGAAPTSPPPAYLPKQKKGLFPVDLGTLRGCLYRDTYLQLGNRTSFWFHPTYIDSLTTTGFKWNGHEWIPWRTDLDRIVSFRCT